MPPRDIVFRSYVARYGRAVACLAVRPIKSSICGPADSGLFIGLYHDPRFPRHKFKKIGRHRISGPGFDVVELPPSF